MPIHAGQLILEDEPAMSAGFDMSQLKLRAAKEEAFGGTFVVVFFFFLGLLRAFIGVFGAFIDVCRRAFLGAWRAFFEFVL